MKEKNTPKKKRETGLIHVLQGFEVLIAIFRFGRVNSEEFISNSPLLPNSLIPKLPTLPCPRVPASPFLRVSPDERMLKTYP